MLAFEVEYLSGVARAANDRGDSPDWPPQPDRLFSALVATWAARGEQPAEREALQWLAGGAGPTNKLG
jgi:CRISPR-associated protein Csb2